MWRVLYAVVPLIGLLFFSPARALAQGETTAAILGQVTDSSNAALPGATVTVTNHDTGLKRSAQTDGEVRCTRAARYMDALRVKVREGGHIRNQAIHVAIAVNLQGNKEVLGLWAAQNEGAKFWLQVLTELQNRGVRDIFIACVDGLKGFPEAIESVYPKAEDPDLWIVHMIRASLELHELETAQASGSGLTEDLSSGDGLGGASATG